MQSLYTRLSALIFCTGMCSVASAAGCQAVLDHTFPALVSGKPQSLCDFSGKVVLVVNTASECGYTPQYEGLEALYKRYEKRGLVVVGFPSNDFGGQEPASNKQVAQFCQLNYGVTFPMFEKTTVTGARANALYADLTRRSGSPPQAVSFRLRRSHRGISRAQRISSLEWQHRGVLRRCKKRFSSRPAHWRRQTR